MLNLAFAFIVMPVQAADVAVKEETPVQDLHCVVMPSAVADVASGVGGRVKTIQVERGDVVRSGQIVAALESGVEQANLVLAKKRAELKTNIHLRQARLEFEQRKVERTDKLHTQQVVSEHIQDEVETDAILAGWQLRQAIDDQSLAKLELARAQEVLSRRSVESPIDGVVVERFKWPGEYVEDEPILRVARLDPLWIEVVAPVSLYGEVSKNMMAEVVAETENGQPREARVVVVDPMADAASGTFRVRLELPNPDHTMLAGIKCNARFPKPARYAPESPDKKLAASKTADAKPAINVESPVPNRDVIQSTSQESVSVKGTSGRYIVLTPPLSSDQERLKLTSRLRDTKINDFQFVGSLRRISFGVFKSTETAERRKSQLSVLGFETDVFALDSAG